MANSFTIEAFSLLGVGLTTISIRTYARCSTVGFRGLKPDDFLMLVAAVSSPQQNPYSQSCLLTYFSTILSVAPTYLFCPQVVYSLETAAAYIVGAWWHGLANNGMTDEQRATLALGSEEWNMRIGGSKTQLVGWSLYTLLLWLLKACMCIFYARLTFVFHLHLIHTHCIFRSNGG